MLQKADSALHGWMFCTHLRPLLWEQGSCTAAAEFLCNSLYDRDQEIRARVAAGAFPLQVLQTVAMQPGDKSLSG